MNRLSLHFLADAFLWDGGERKNAVALYAYDYLGAEEYFSGYAYYLTPVRQSVRGLIEVRINPFVAMGDEIHFYERGNLRLRVESGQIVYFHFGEETQRIHSVDATFTYFFNFFTDRKSYFYITWAKPLEKIPDYQERLDDRFYFGVLF